MAEAPKARARSPSRPPPPPAIFYGPVGPGNPVVDSFEKDLHECLSFLRRNREAEDAGSMSQELHRRGATTLFNIWNKYKHRFPDSYYKEKLVKVGDQLMEIKEYKLALVQCYGQYLQQVSAVDLDMPELDVHQFQSSFFPNGVRDKTAAVTFHVLQARNVCMYKIVCNSDMDLLNQESLKTCFTVLSILRLIMQITLPHEHLCWIVYNGTIYVYTICRHLMTVGQSAKVLEYLLWACVCMESSVPILAVHYLTWRTTLYAAVCQCYYDCQLGIHGEVFARRGLSKIDELKQMENLSSSSLHVETKQIFKEATVKMATMIFKRSAFEPRRKPKGFLRPRLKTNLREAQYLPWPRTITERLLLELFDCNSSHFFAILEALFDRNRRTLIPSPPVPDELEIHDVVSELFFAGMDIVSGGVHGISSSDHPGVITASSSLMELILAGKSTVTAEATLRFMKMAFSYEEWDAFDQTAGLFFTFIKSQDNSLWKKAEAELKLLLIMQSLLSPRKPRHNLCVQENNIKDSLQLDREMVIDATMFLWQKCKAGIQKILESGNNYLKTARKYQTSKWVHILYIINEVIHMINFGDANAVVMAEVALRFTEVMENTADYTLKSENLSVREKMDSVPLSEFFIGDMPSLMQRCPSEQLLLAYECLDKAVNAMTHARSVLPAGTLVLDNCCKRTIKKVQGRYTELTLNKQNLNGSPENEAAQKSMIGNNFIMDLHLELILAQHRVAIKLFNLAQDIPMNDSDEMKVVLVLQWEHGCRTYIEVYALHCLNYHILHKENLLPRFKHCFTEQDVMNKIKKNKLSRALFLMQKAVLLLPAELASSSPKQLLEEAFVLIQKAEAEQNALCTSLQQLAATVKSKVPPPPVLLSRSYSSVSFKPAPFTSDVKVSWYAVFGCVAQGSIPKVRLNNYSLKNTAELVQAHENCVLEVKDLEPNEMYVFAVAAYSSDGKLIGNGIGETTKPVLAYPPLSAATARAYLIQCAFQIENYTLSKKAFQPLWDYFVSAPHSPVADAEIVSISSSLTISQYRLIPDTVHHASPNLLYLFLRSIFIINDIHVTDRALFSDSVSFSELKYSRQVARLAECERMLMALELSNWLNDVQYALQSVVHCYGLIAPLIFHRIHSVPLIQVLIKCLTVLQEIPCSTLQRKSAGCYENIQHMIACSSFFTAKVLRSWKEYELAIVIINYGKRLLDPSQPTTQVPPPGEGADEILEDETPSRRLRSQIAAAEKVNENLEALESTLLKLTKPGQELTGDEDALLLYPVVKNWHTKIAYKEVLKFKKNPRFLEFFVQFLLRAVNEERFSRIIEWADETQDYLKKRQREELRRIAFCVLTQKLNYFSNVFLKRRRFHHVCIEEMPWRAQMNIYLAVVHFILFKKRMEELYTFEMHSLQNLNRYGVLDPEKFSLNSSGTIVVWAAIQEEKKVKSSPVVKGSPSGKFRKKTDEASEYSIKLNEKHPRCQSTSEKRSSTVKERERALAFAAMLDHFNKLFLHLRRAVVIAHRGGHWTLLQNACRSLWNYTQEVRLITKNLQSLHGPFPITWDLFLNTIWLPYYLASDSLLDMIVDLQSNNSVKIIEVEGDFCVPSCIGGIANDEGGFNLSFENPFDDVNIVDLKGIYDLILRTLEILFHLKKWESLAYLALQFNTLTHERYTEVVTPLLVFAQRQLQERMQLLSDSKSPQLDSKSIIFVNDTVNKVPCRHFISTKLHVAGKRNARSLDHHFHSTDENQARSLVSVPVDVTDSLKCFRESLEKSKHHSRALKYSRKLLSLFLADTQEALQTNDQQDLRVQALHELGNLHFCTGNKRAAFKCWCQGLDGALNIVNALHHWHELAGLSENDTGNLANRSQVYCEKFIARAGIWGCIQGGVLAAKIAQHILLEDVKLRTKTCILSAVLFKSLFRASLPHPIADCDFTQYEIEELIPGIDLFVDNYRADVASVVGSLSFIMFELHCCKQNLIILPLFSLYQYFVSEVCRNAIKCIEGRILKIKVLTDLGFFSDAFHELCTVNFGDKVPWKLPAGYKFVPKLQACANFDESLPLLAIVNLEVIEDVFNRPLHSVWTSLCDSRIMNNLILAKMHFILSLSATINCIPEKVMKATYCVDSDTLRKGGKTAHAVLKVSERQESAKGLCNDPSSVELPTIELLDSPIQQLNPLVSEVSVETGPILASPWDINDIDPHRPRTDRSPLAVSWANDGSQPDSRYRRSRTPRCEGHRSEECLGHRHSRPMLSYLPKQELRLHSPTYFDPPVSWDRRHNMSYWFTSYPMSTSMPWLTPRSQSDWDHGSRRSRSLQCKSKPSVSQSKPPEEPCCPPSPLRSAPALPPKVAPIPNTPVAPVLPSSSSVSNTGTDDSERLESPEDPSPKPTVSDNLPISPSEDLSSYGDLVKRMVHSLGLSIVQPQPSVSDTVFNVVQINTSTLIAFPLSTVLLQVAKSPAECMDYASQFEGRLVDKKMSSKKPLSFPEFFQTSSALAGILLAEAEERISSILESMQSKYDRVISRCSAADLEIVIEAKLQLAAIAQQRLQTAFSAALAFSTIKLLQDADVFKKTSDLPQDKEKRDEPNEHDIYIEDSHVLHNVIAQERMNIHLWLRCRLALVTAITAQIRGIETMTENELAECSCLISEVQVEAEAFNDVEILAEIMMQAVMLGLQERQPVTDIKLHLQDIIRLLEEKTLISSPASLTLVKSMLLLSDIMRTQTEDESKHISKTDQLDLLILAHRLVIEQLFILGESIKQNAEEPTFMTPVLPLKNIYLPHIRLLAKVKMRIGHTLALELSCSPKINQLQWQQALRHTETALELCRASVQRELDLEAEILFWKGKLERQITVIGNNKSTSAVETLLEAIKLSLQNYQNYGLIRRSYLEVAMLYFYLITAKKESLSAVKGKAFKAKATNAHYASSDDFTAMEMYRVQAWIAVRAAAQVSEAILSYQKLIGRKAVKLYQVRGRVQRNIPEFALLDLGSSYKDFLSGGYEVTYKVPSIGSCAQGQEDCDAAESSSYEDMQARLKITWVHLIRYNTYLNRLLNMSPLLAVPKAGEGLFAKENVLFTSVFDIGTTLRLAEMHSFLKTHLPIYSACCLEAPPKQLHSFEQMRGSTIALAKSTSESIGMSYKPSAAEVSSSSSCSSQTEGYFDNKATCTSLKELCVQWYLPSVEKSSKGETMVLFVYAYNVKPVKIISITSFHSANVFCGYLWIPLNSVVAVREKLSNLKQKIEMLMHSTVSSRLIIETHSFLSPESRSTIERVVIDKKTEEMVRQCLSEIKSLLSIGPNQPTPISEIPFDITLPAINNLWKLFDPANGCVITAGNIFNWIVSLLS
ncbi:PREDICTED: cilia- and flagella-associated protein 54 [Gekko japonicus]|uniref:Cilia- and flagella-associated protein 54 n=1 Tax=Gekko japonicus TaxID=146911 RepID=A0ABM1KDH1_GEKJA|nr:PREDICTED: cilia- and flagella-associated protein 54 [Gekko japonicus]